MSAPVLAGLVLGVAALYGAAGVVIALIFAAGGVNRLLGRQTQVTPLARLIMMPAAAALWPLLVGRWRRR